MKLGDLIIYLRENILHDRSNQIAGAVSSYLWSDATLALHIDEAQRRIARKAAVIRDGTNPQTTQFRLVAGQAIYQLDPSVLGVISCKLDTDPGDLIRAGHAQFDTNTTPDPYFWDTASLATIQPDKPRAYSTDEYLTLADDGTDSIVNLRMYPAPSTVYDAALVRMRVVRLPINRLTLSNLAASPEVPEMYHLQMLDWAAYLCLRMVDIDGGSPNRAAEFKASFEATVEEINVEFKEKEFQPATWGFGRGGFSYER